jgi:hypothetical protein
LFETFLEAVQERRRPSHSAGIRDRPKLAPLDRRDRAASSRFAQFGGHASDETVHVIGGDTAQWLPSNLDLAWT